jgi:hypothetical protein
VSTAHLIELVLISAAVMGGPLLGALAWDAAMGRFRSQGA